MYSEETILLTCTNVKKSEMQVRFYITLCNWFFKTMKWPQRSIILKQRNLCQWFCDSCFSYQFQMHGFNMVYFLLLSSLNAAPSSKVFIVFLTIVYSLHFQHVDVLISPCAWQNYQWVLDSNVLFLHTVLFFNYVNTKLCQLRSFHYVYLSVYTVKLIQLCVFRISCLLHCYSV